ncbi:unnamed protein product [Lota lota]
MHMLAHAWMWEDWWSARSTLQTIWRSSSRPKGQRDSVAQRAALDQHAGPARRPCHVAGPRWTSTPAVPRSWATLDQHAGRAA